MDENFLASWRQAGVFEEKDQSASSGGILNKSMDWFMNFAIHDGDHAMISAFLNFIISRGFLRRLGLIFLNYRPLEAGGFLFTSWEYSFGWVWHF